jgi:hypothetical protein
LFLHPCNRAPNTYRSILKTVKINAVLNMVQFTRFQKHSLQLNLYVSDHNDVKQLIKRLLNYLYGYHFIAYKY